MNTHPRHWWGEIQVRLGRCRLMRAAGDQEWSELAHAVRSEVNLRCCSAFRRCYRTPSVRECVEFVIQELYSRVGEASVVHHHCESVSGAAHKAKTRSKGHTSNPQSRQ